MSSHRQHEIAGRIIAAAIEKFETPMTDLVREIALENEHGIAARHLYILGDDETFCGQGVSHRNALAGYNFTCDACAKLEKRIRQARSAEGHRRVAARRQEAPKPRCALRVQIEEYLATLDDTMSCFDNHSEQSLAQDELRAFYKHVKGEGL